MTGKEIKHWLVEQGIKSKELARLVGVHSQVMSRWAVDRYPAPANLRGKLKFIEKAGPETMLNDLSATDRGMTVAELVSRLEDLPGATMVRVAGQGIEISRLSIEPEYGRVTLVVE